MNEKVWAHRTDRGRVVYDRPLHTFTQKDLDRILRTMSEDADLAFIRELLEHIENYMLGLILAPIGQSDKAGLVRNLLESFVGQLLRKAAGIFKIQITYIPREGKPFSTTLV